MAVTTPYIPIVVQIVANGSVTIPFDFPSGSSDFVIVHVDGAVVDPAMYTIVPSDLTG